MSLDQPKQEGFLASDVEALKRSIQTICVTVPEKFR